MARPRKLGRGNIFKRVDEFRQEQRARRTRETIEQSRRVPRPDRRDEPSEAASQDDRDK